MSLVLQSLLESLQHCSSHQTCSGDGEIVVCDLLVREGGQEIVAGVTVLWPAVSCLDQLIIIIRYSPGCVDVVSQVCYSVTVIQLDNQPRPISKSHLDQTKIIDDSTE